MNTTPATEQKKRPIFLTVLCVIAFVHVGLSILIGLFGTIMSPKIGWFEVSGMFDIVVWGANRIGLFLSIILLILAVISFFGIIQIWNQMKSGVWVFSIPMVLFVIMPFLSLSRDLWFILVPNLIIIPLLILLFIYNYRKLD